MKRILPGLLLIVSTLLLPGKEIVFSETFDQQPEGSIKEVSTTLVKKSGN